MDDGQLTRDLKHIDALVFAPGPLLERLKNIAEYATEAVTRASFAGMSDEQLGMEWSLAYDALSVAREGLSGSMWGVREPAFVDAYTRLRHVRAEALRRGVTL
jgi:hypothetical protein